MAAGWNNGRCVRWSTGIALREVEALHPSGGDQSQHPALQGWRTADEPVLEHTGAGIQAGYTARCSFSRHSHNRW